MAIKTSLGTIMINDGKDVLIREVLRMLPYTTVTLLGPAGTGKTTIIEEIAEKAGFIDELVILRLQGLSSEDFRMPMLVEERIPIKLPEGKSGQLNLQHFEMPQPKKTVEFAKMGVLKAICDNPKKNYLIMFDEILRAEQSVATLLFELFERKIDGIFRPNMFVMTAANYGEEYISNIDYSDPALRRRQIFIEWQPNKDDIVEYMLTNQYHPIIQEVAESLSSEYLINYNLGNQDLEQTTQLGSWALLNNRWKHMEEKENLKLNYKSAKEDVTIFGNYMFNDIVKLEIINKLTLFEQINTIDLQKEIIENQGLNTPGYVMHDKKGNVYDYENRKTELLIRTKYFIKNEIFKNEKYLQDNAENIVLLFEGKPEMFLSFFNDMCMASELRVKILYKDDTRKISEEAYEFQKKLIKVMVNVKTKNAKDPRISKIFKNFGEGLDIKNSALR